VLPQVTANSPDMGQEFVAAKEPTCLKYPEASLHG
jgi:hypothetical protein